eukprot:CAMPEP_0204833530 /NCGR_PEP_ID=MMETSP1346-20131115/17054_1 /ASSEMBLY_ACC=CAM_ASM_000771 /TAXON_ID=215587 /ORGANISM="Aplanochytrium stocchinoi, Strain GSBS06" /LENGTH=680 /DNA_ID=CAMNT_0051966127 /DNA_START=1 /DNA_END=2039 /DNA_ORIENTATION=-
MENVGSDTEKFCLKGFQGLILSQLQKSRLPESQEGVVLAYPHGCGKTVCCCFFLHQLSSSYACTVNRDSKAANLETIKVTANRESVLAVAKEINSFLSSTESIKREAFLQSKTCWQITKQAWLTLTPGKNVSYTSPVVAAYSCGTTLLHSVFLFELLDQYYLDNLSGKHWLILCGGSAAELIALKLLAQSKEKEQHFESVNCVDINSWDGACKQIWNQDHSFVFRQMDILSSKSTKLLEELVGHADIVTLVYGLTEIHDSAPERARQCINLVFQNLKENAEFLLIDPIKTCHGKDLWIDSIALEHAGITENGVMSGKCFKLCMNEHDVCDSAVNQWIQKMNLRLNEDVKLSMHVWCRHFKKKDTHILKYSASDTSPETNGSDANIAIYVVNTAAKVDYTRSWLENSKMPSKVRVVDFEGLGVGETEQTIQSRLFHALSSLRSCTSGFQVCLVTIKQMHFISLNSKLLQIFKNSFVAVLDDFDQYIPLNSPKKVKNIMRILSQTLPSANRRIILCPSHVTQTFKYARELCNTSLNDNKDTISTFPLNPLMINELNGFYIDHCVADNKSECKGYLSEKTAAFVKFDNRVKEPGNKLIVFPKDLEHMTNPFPEAVDDVVLLGKKLVKFPDEKIHDLIFKAYGKAAYVGKQNCKEHSEHFGHTVQKIKNQQLKSSYSSAPFYIN